MLFLNVKKQTNIKSHLGNSHKMSRMIQIANDINGLSVRIGCVCTVDFKRAILNFTQRQNFRTIGQQIIKLL